MKMETLLHRQVHPTWIQEGRITSMVFRPTPKDENLLSVYDGNKITAENSWTHFSERGLESVGVLSVNVEECSSLALEAREDPETFPEHALIDFTGKAKSLVERCAKQLRTMATTRGWQYKPE